MELIARGKTKEVWRAEPGRVLIRFTDAITAGDGAKREELAGKGALVASISAKLFEHLEARGIPTHYLGQVSASSLLAKELRMYPLEAVVRFSAAGSLCRRLGLAKGEKLNPPLVEFFLKDDRLGDPLLCRAHMELLGLAKREETQEMEELALAGARALRDLFAERGLSLVDVKFEMGRDPDGTLRIGDEISPDTMRLWNREGESFDKDIYRAGGNPLDAYRKVLEIVK